MRRLEFSETLKSIREAGAPKTALAVEELSFRVTVVILNVAADFSPDALEFTPLVAEEEVGLALPVVLLPVLDVDDEERSAVNPVVDTAIAEEADLCAPLEVEGFHGEGVVAMADPPGAEEDADAAAGLVGAIEVDRFHAGVFSGVADVVDKEFVAEVAGEVVGS